MMHILEDTFYQWVFADGVPSAQEQAHLHQCPSCHAYLLGLHQMAQEFQIARASEPSTAALTRYYHFFEEIAQFPSLVQRLGTWLTAQLQWDGRHQPAWQGVRNAQRVSYRLLYVTDEAEIELLIAPQEGQCQIEGEVIALRDRVPGQCEIYALPAMSPLATTPCDPDGRFRLGTFPVGHYQLHIRFDQDDLTLVIDDLELS
ncbi:MAG: hypothetical protein KF832_30595 [Caldilineaceae bacterium]|nr:hypothetical protein [Caldilineaceae bacterium]